MLFHEGPDLSTVLQNVILHPLAEELQDDVIKAFREMLSREGAVALMTDVKTIGKDPAKIVLFQRYLVETVLKPMKLLRAVTPGPPNPSSPENYPAAILRIQQQESL
ncbi:hypothetical protein CSOJ01_05848, partial [Colletotrichum sojae]